MRKLLSLFLLLAGALPAFANGYGAVRFVAPGYRVNVVSYRAFVPVYYAPTFAVSYAPPCYAAPAPVPVPAPVPPPAPVNFAPEVMPPAEVEAPAPYCPPALAYEAPTYFSSFANYFAGFGNYFNGFSRAFYGDSFYGGRFFSRDIVRVRTRGAAVNVNVRAPRRQVIRQRTVIKNR